MFICNTNNTLRLKSTFIPIQYGYNDNQKQRKNLKIYFKQKQGALFAFFRPTLFPKDGNTIATTMA